MTRSQRIKNMLAEFQDQFDRGEEDHLNPRREQIDLAETILQEMILAHGLDHSEAHRLLSTYGWGRWNLGWNKGWDSGRGNRA